MAAGHTEACGAEAGAAAPALEWDGGGTCGVSGSDVADLFLEPVELQVRQWDGRFAE